MEDFLLKYPILKNPFFIIVVTLWVIYWKLSALWKSSGNKQLIWFIFLYLFNTLGILEIIYLKYFQKKLDRLDIKTIADLIKEKRIYKKLFKH